MLKYFELLLELLRTDDDPDVINMKKNFLAAWQKIEERWDRNLQIFHKCGFVFSAYDALLQWKLSLDEFLATWDITSKNTIFNNWTQSAIEFLTNIINWNTKELWNIENTLFIMDTISFLTLSNNEKEIVKNRTKNNNSEIIFC